MVKPEFWGDEKLAPLPPLVRLVFIGLVSMADDAGRLVDNLKSIDGFLFPHTEDTARQALAQLAELGRIQRYTAANGQRVIQVVNWSRHQRVDHPSANVLPPPPGDDSGESREPVASDSRGPRSLSGAGVKREAERDQEAERGDAHAREGSPPSPPAQEVRAMPGVAAFLRACYGEAPPARVLEELGATLGHGVELKGKQVRAFDRAHLNDVCREIAEKPPKKRNVGMHFVLLRLGDTWLEAKADREKRAFAQPENGRRRRSEPERTGEPAAPEVSDAEVEAYFAAHFDEAKRIQDDVAKRFEGWPANRTLSFTRDQTLKAELRKAYVAARETAAC